MNEHQMMKEAELFHLKKVTKKSQTLVDIQNSLECMSAAYVNKAT